MAMKWNKRHSISPANVSWYQQRTQGDCIIDDEVGVLREFLIGIAVVNPEHAESELGTIDCTIDEIMPKEFDSSLPTHFEPVGYFWMVGDEGEPGENPHGIRPTLEEAFADVDAHIEKLRGN